MWTCGDFSWSSLTGGIQVPQLIGYQKRSGIPFSCGGAYRHAPTTYIFLLIAALPTTSSNNFTSTRQPPSGNRKLGATTTPGYERCQWDTYGERNARYSFHGHLRMTSISGGRSKTQRWGTSFQFVPVSARPVADTSVSSGLQLLPEQRDCLQDGPHLPSNGRDGTWKCRVTDSSE